MREVVKSHFYDKNALEDEGNCARQWNCLNKWNLLVICVIEARKSNCSTATVAPWKPGPTQYWYTRHKCTEHDVAVVQALLTVGVGCHPTVDNVKYLGRQIMKASGRGMADENDVISSSSEIIKGNKYFNEVSICIWLHCYVMIYNQ